MRCSPPTPPGTPSQFGISTLRSEPRLRDASETSQHQRRSRAVVPAAPAEHEEVSPPSV